MTDYKLIGIKIRERRSDKNMTQEMLAEKSDLSVSYISNVETGKKKISLTAILKICAALDISLNALLFGNQDYVAEDTLTSDFDNLLKDCNRFEKQLIFEAARSEKQSLKKYEELIIREIKEINK